MASLAKSEAPAPHAKAFSAGLFTPNDASALFALLNAASVTTMFIRSARH
jgi:hypothetical protein